MQASSTLNKNDNHAALCLDIAGLRQCMRLSSMCMFQRLNIKLTMGIYEIWLGNHDEFMKSMCHGTLGDTVTA